MSQWQSQKLSRKTVWRGCKENKRCKLTAETTNVTCCLRIRCRAPDARLCLRAHDGLVRDSLRANPAPEHNVKRVEKPRNHVCEYVFTVWRRRHLKSAFWSDVYFPLFRLRQRPGNRPHKVGKRKHADKQEHVMEIKRPPLGGSSVTLPL